MRGFIIRRVTAVALALVVQMVIVFLVVRVLPGDPATVMLGTDARSEEVKRVKEELGLEKPYHAQFFDWAYRMFTGNMGRSYFLGSPVVELFLSGMSVTLTLSFLAMFISVAIGIPVGVASAISKRKTLFSSLTMIMLSTPNFVIAVALIAVTVQVTGTFPSFGAYWKGDVAGFLSSLALPALTLALPVSGVVAKQVASNIAFQLSEGYVATAIAKGLGRASVTYYHVLRNVMIPVVASLVDRFSILIGGALVIEQVFGLPGLGRIFVKAALDRDYPIVQAFSFLILALVALIHTLADLVYGYLDPRAKVA